MEMQIKNEFNHDRLRLARVAAAKSYLDIGELLNVTRQYAHKLEVNAIPSQKQLKSLANYLNVEESFFLVPRKKIIELEQCHFRSLRSSTLNLKKTIIAQVEIFEEIQSHLENEVIFPNIRIPDLGKEDNFTSDFIEQIAEKLRRDIGLGLGPISNMIKLAEKIGCLVLDIAEVDDRIDAFSIYRDRPLIIRNIKKSNACRLRFDIGHELGHLFLHQGIETGCHITEGQANQFASALLIPRVSFANEFPIMRGNYLNWSALAKFKIRWGVSFKAIIYRANKLGLLNDKQAKTGFIYLARHGYTKEEEFDDQIPMEYPTVIQKALNILDFKTWNNIIRSVGVTNGFILMHYLINPPQNHLKLIQSN